MTDMTYAALPFVPRPVSRILYGTARLEVMLGGRRALRLLDEIAATGTTTFDTARAYPGCERALGAWMRARRNRDAITVLSKGAHPTPVRRARVDSASIRSDLDTSRRRLGTDFIDIYLLHRDDETVDVRSIVDTMNQLHDAGRIGAFGASNWTHARIQAANDYARSQRMIPFTLSSPHFSLATLHADPYAGGVTISGPGHADARAWYRASGMPVIAWASLAGGFFSGRLDSSDPNAARKALPVAYRKAFAQPDNFERLRRVERLAQETGFTVPQIALAWTRHRGMDVLDVVTASSGSRMRQNIASLSIELTSDQAAHLDLDDHDGA